MRYFIIGTWISAGIVFLTWEAIGWYMNGF